MLIAAAVAGSACGDDSSEPADEGAPTCQPGDAEITVTDDAGLIVDYSGCEAPDGIEDTWCEDPDTSAEVRVDGETVADC